MTNDKTTGATGAVTEETVTDGASTLSIELPEGDLEFFATYTAGGHQHGTPPRTDRKQFLAEYRQLLAATGGSRAAMPIEDLQAWSRPVTPWEKLDLPARA